MNSYLFDIECKKVSMSVYITLWKYLNKKSPIVV